MGTRYLLDTNIVIDFAAGNMPEHTQVLVTDSIDNSPQISVINKIELLGFSNVPAPIIQFVDVAKVFGLDDVVIEKTIELRKKYKIKLPDAVIAATAIVNNLTLVTRNQKDFSSLTELELLNPWTAKT